jgi:hypothetical protein
LSAKYVSQEVCPCYNIAQNNGTKKTISFLILLAGTAATGLALGLSLAFTLSQLLKNQVAGWGGLVGALTGIAIGYPLGIIIGQAIFRRKFRGLDTVRFGRARPFVPQPGVDLACILSSPSITGNYRLPLETPRALTFV